MKSEIAILFIRIFAGIFGVLFLYVSMFLYESQEKEIQNKLEDLWIRIDDIQKQAIAKHVAFLRIVFDSTRIVLEKIFDKQLFSLQSFGVTLCFVLGTIEIFSGAKGVQLQLLGILSVPGYPMGYAFIALRGLAIILLGLLPMFFKFEDKKLSRSWFVLVFVGTFLYTSGFTIGTRFYVPNFLNGFYNYIYFTLLPSVYFFVVIVIFRKFLLRRSDSGIVIFPLLYIWTPVLLVVFLYRFISFETLLFMDYPDINSLLYNSVFVTYPFVMIFTLVSIFSFTMLLHRLLWPIIEKPVYSLQRIGIATKKKFFGFLGLALLLTAAGFTPSMIIQIFGGIP